MAKEQVFIVVSHKKHLAPKSRTEWIVTETVEFVNHLKSKHYQMSVVIGDYLNEKITLKSPHFADYSALEAHVRARYPKQMKYLDSAYKPHLITDEETTDESTNVETEITTEQQTSSVEENPIDNAENVTTIIHE